MCSNSPMESNADIVGNKYPRRGVRCKTKDPLQCFSDSGKCTIATGVRMSRAGIRGYRSFTRDNEVLKHKLAPGTVQRILKIGRPYFGILGFFLFLVILDAAAGV